MYTIRFKFEDGEMHEFDVDNDHDLEGYTRRAKSAIENSDRNLTFKFGKNFTKVNTKLVDYEVIKW